MGTDSRCRAAYQRSVMKKRIIPDGDGLKREGSGPMQLSICEPFSHLAFLACTYISIRSRCNLNKRRDRSTETQTQQDCLLGWTATASRPQPSHRRPLPLLLRSIPQPDPTSIQLPLSLGT